MHSTRSNNPANARADICNKTPIQTTIDKKITRVGAFSFPTQQTFIKIFQIICMCIIIRSTMERIYSQHLSNKLSRIIFIGDEIRGFAPLGTPTSQRVNYGLYECCFLYASQNKGQRANVPPGTRCADIALF